MKTLTTESLRRATAFLERTARPLERALGSFHFSSGPAPAVREALACFQNDDGGFGHGLEPDVRCAESSAYLTGLALRTMRETGLAHNDSLVVDAVGYLARTVDESRLVWPALPAAAQRAPRAPWWGDEGTGIFARLETTFDGFRFVPRVCIVDALVSFGALRQDDAFDAVVRDTLATIANASPEQLGGGSTAFSDSVRLVSNPDLRDDDLRDAAAQTLARHLPALIQTNPQAWESHAATPLSLLPEPVAAHVHPAVAAAAESAPIADATAGHLDWTIEHQDADGAWYPGWDWMGDYPDAWEVARIEWAGIVTLGTLRSLRAYGRLEGQD